MRSRCDAGVQGDPPDVATHDLGDHAPLVGVAGRAKAVHRIGGDVHGGVEPERVVGGAQVVVDRLGDAEDVDTVLPKAVGRGERAFTADGQDAVDTGILERASDVLGAAAGALVGVGAAGSQDRAADLRQALHVVAREGKEVAVDDPAPSVTDADEIEPIRRRALEDHAADDRVQTGAVAAAGEDADSHVPSLLVFPDARWRRCLHRH